MKNLKYVIKNTFSRLSSQEENKINFQHDFELIHAHLKKDPIKFLENKCTSYRLGLGALLKMTDFGRRVCYYTQNNIAKSAGISVSSVKRVIADLISDGLLIKAKRKWNTDVLKISNIFRESWLKKRLRAFYGMILFLPVSMLLSFSKQTCLSEYELLLKEEKNIYLHDMHVFKKKKHKKHVFEAKRRKSFSMSISTEKMELISQVNFVKLTRRGITELVKFPEAALKFALTQVPFMSVHIKNKFTWFCKMAWNHSRSNGLQLDYGLYDKCKDAAQNNGTWDNKTHEEHVRVIKREIAKSPYEDQEWRLDLKPVEEFEKAKNSGKLNPKGLAFLESCGLIPSRDKMSRAPVVDKLSTVEKFEVCTVRAPLVDSSEPSYELQEDDQEETGYDPSLDPFGDRYVH